ncbi:hypothetical protein [uncultured Mediterranean phage uvMED]|nr:hypothetical protein [uncultured Mediterranean phage uvMED]|tara:strand:+ start:8601 stop:8888 length:288 start_codon:yes stop_codon:yes gene_type:complete
MTENKPNKLIGLDGMTRESKDEENLNTLCFGVFNTVSGKEILKYLKSLTLDAVAGPEISNEQLRHLEGQRYIVGLLQRRINKGTSQKLVKENNNG